MNRNAGALLFIFVAGGCMSVDTGSGTDGGLHSKFGHGYKQPTVPGVVGPYGTPVSMKAPYNATPPMGQRAAMAMMSRSMPAHMVQNSPSGVLPMNGMPLPNGAAPPTMMTPPGGLLTPPGMPFAPGVGGKGPIRQAQHTTPTLNGPAMPGMPGLPGMPGMPRPGKTPPGAVAAFGANIGQHSPIQFSVKRTQVRFVEPVGMKVSWFTQMPGGAPSYSPLPIETPGRYNFTQGAIYRLKLTNIKYYPNMPPVYPTMEVVPANINTATFLAHSSVPIQFTKEDFDHVVKGNFLVKVIYLPYPRFQDLAGAGPNQILSTQLEPGVDPIKEALRRGSILLVLRMGSIDQEAPNTPGLAAPGAQGMMPRMPHAPRTPGPMVPYLGVPVGPGGHMAPPHHVGHPGVGPAPAPANQQPKANTSKTSLPRMGVPPTMGQQPINGNPNIAGPKTNDLRIPGPTQPLNQGVPKTPIPFQGRPSERPAIPPVPPSAGQLTPTAPEATEPAAPGAEQLELPMIPSLGGTNGQ